MQCRYCKRKMRVSQQAYAENPFCKHCLHERMQLAAAQDPVILRIRESNGYIVFVRRSDLQWT